MSYLETLEEHSIPQPWERIWHFVHHVGPADIPRIPEEEKRTLKSIIDDIADKGLTSDDDKVFESAYYLLYEIGHHAPGQKPSFAGYHGINEDIFLYALEASGRHLSTLVSYMQSETASRERHQSAMHLIQTILTKNVSPDLKAATTRAVEENYHMILRRMLTGQFYFGDGVYYLLQQHPDWWNMLGNDLEKAASTIDRADFYPQVYAPAQSDDPYERTFAEYIALWSLQHLGYSQEGSVSLLTKWKNLLRAHEHFNFHNVASNFEHLFAIEHAQPGISRWLTRERGIMHFGRYSTEFLVSQFTQQDDTSHPWGIILYPYADWNGAFHRDMWVFNDIREQLQQIKDAHGVDFRVRIFESGNVRTIRRLLLPFFEKYGAISFAIIGGHGTPYTIDFGEGRTTGEFLTPRTITSKSGIARVFKEMFLPNAPIVLASCSTGMEHGIGQTLSRHNLHVVAPNAPGSLRKIDVSLTNEVIGLKALYGDAETNQYSNGSLTHHK